MIDISYKIQELIPAENSISGKDFWADVLVSGPPLTKTDGEELIKTLRGKGINARLVKITTEVIMEDYE